MFLGAQCSLRPFLWAASCWRGHCCARSVLRRVIAYLFTLCSWRAVVLHTLRISPGCRRLGARCLPWRSSAERGHQKAPAGAQRAPEIGGRFDDRRGDLLPVPDTRRGRTGGMPVGGVIRRLATAAPVAAHRTLSVRVSHAVGVGVAYWLDDCSRRPLSRIVKGSFCLGGTRLLFVWLSSGSMLWRFVVIYARRSGLEWHCDQRRRHRRASV